jgi:spore maturation protein CgeB
MAALRKTIGRAGSIDLAIVCYDFLTPAESAEVKRLTKAPLVLWYPDAIANFQRHMFLNGAYDALFFKDPYIVDILRRNLAVPVYYLPECFCPHAMPAPVADEPIEERFRCDIATAGNMYAYRIAFFRNLADYEVRLWGLPPPLWMNLGPVAPMVQSRFIAGAEKARAFRGAKIVLNNLHPAEIWGANVRMFEVCGAGAFQIVDWRPGVEQLFAIGEEIVTFRSLAELKGKIDHFLAQPEERQAIAAAGRARALKDHTYEQRLKLLIETVQGRSLGYPEPTVTYASA